MLGKLLKYEFRATSRWYLPVYIAIITLAAILRVTMQISYRMDIMVLPMSVTAFLYALAVIAMCVMTVVLAVWRFFSSMTGPEAYMTFSLPVSVWLNVAVKALTAVIWTLASMVVGGISVLICTYYNGFIEDVLRAAKTFMMTLQLTVGQFGGREFTAGNFTALMIFLLFSAILQLFMIYLAIALGQLVRSHRILGAFGAYIILNLINRTLTGGAISIISLNFPKLWKMIQGWMLSVIAENGIMIASILITAALSAIYYALTCWLFERRLNLE